MASISSQDGANANSCDNVVSSRKRKRSPSPPMSYDTNEEASSGGFDISPEYMNLSDFKAGNVQRPKTLDYLYQICTPQSPPLSPEDIFNSHDGPEFKVPLPPKRLVPRRVCIQKFEPLQDTCKMPPNAGKEGGKKKRRRRGQGKKLSEFGGKLDHKMIRRGAEIEKMKRDFFQEKGLIRVEILQQETDRCVMLARSKSNTADLTVIKIFIEKEKDGHLKDHETFAIETGILKYSRHPNIISLGSVIQCPEYYAFTLPYYPGGDLFEHLEHIPDTDMMLHYFTQICDALRYLHMNRIIHGDVKCENVLLQYGGKDVVLTDFGQSHLLSRDCSLVSTWQGSYGYIGPEFSEGKFVCGFKMESYSLGVLLWYMAIRHNSELSQEFFSPSMIQNGWPVEIDAFVRKLLSRLLTSDPTQRATIHDIFQILKGRKSGKR